MARNSTLVYTNNPRYFGTGNAAQLETLIRNLLDNAIKFTPSGGQANVKLSRSDEGVHQSVFDTGISIPEDDLPHLFSRFHRGRNASPYPGSGLGLAIVKAIADKHGVLFYSPRARLTLPYIITNQIVIVVL